MATESKPAAVPLQLETLQTFQFTRILSHSAFTGSVYLLGTIDDQPAIIHLRRTVLPPERAVTVIESGLAKLDLFLENKPASRSEVVDGKLIGSQYFSAHGCLNTTLSLPDFKVTIIWPATPVHIRKYESQPMFMVHETPEMYERVVTPYMASFPPERLDWVYNILDGKKEKDRVVFDDKDEASGFIILPDLKWDQTSMSALYLTVLVRTRTIKCLRDLTSAHLSLLRSIRTETYRVTNLKFNVKSEKLRLFVHYQPSYYHFHVHVVHIEHEGLAGMTVGQAHLLDDIISLLELSPPPPERSLLSRMTFTYALGREHGLYSGLSDAQSETSIP